MTSHFSLNVFILKIYQILLIIMAQILFHIPPKLTISNSIFQNFLNIGERSPLPKPHPRHKPFHILMLTFLSPLQNLKGRPCLQSPLSCSRNLITFFAYLSQFFPFTESPFLRQKSDHLFCLFSYFSSFCTYFHIFHCIIWILSLHKILSSLYKV